MADTTAPLLQRTLPADNATGVSITGNLGLGFGEAVRAGSGLIKIYKSDGSLFLSIAANDTSQVTLDSTGTRVTINPSVSLLAGTSFCVLIDPGAFEDLAGNDYAGLSSPTAFNFSTAGSGGGNPPADTTAPTLTNKSPADDTGNVPVGASLVLTFSEAIKADTGSIQIHGSNGTLVTIDVTDASQIAIVGNQLTINPASNLAANTSYYVTFGSGVIRDLANNAYSGIVSQTQFNFSTADSYVDKTIPLLLFKPKYETYGSVSQNVVLTFNEPVKAGTGFIEIRDRADGSLYRSISVNDASQVTFSDRSITLNPSADLDLNRAYTVVLGGRRPCDHPWRQFNQLGQSHGGGFRLGTVRGGRLFRAERLGYRT